MCGACATPDAAASFPPRENDATAHNDEQRPPQLGITLPQAIRQRRGACLVDVNSNETGHTGSCIVTPTS